MIKNYFCYLLLSLISLQALPQKVINIVMVGPDGITEDPQKANSFIVIKMYPDAHFERLDYTKGGPLVKLRTYKGEELKILDGRYFEYAENGSLALSGHYLNNAKDDYWNSYDDTGKVIKSLKYLNDSIVEVVDLNKPEDKVEYPDELEASFPGGDKAWVKYLTKQLEKDNPASKSFHGGHVFINFMVDTDGSIKDIYLSRSVEYILDETSLKIISESPNWHPAFQNGKHVKAYRRQPLTFIQE